MTGGSLLGDGSERAVKRLRELTRRFRQDVAVYRLVLQDRRTPWVAKLLLGAAVAYALSPIDLIPDFIPVLGHLDDLLIVPLLAWAGLRLVPAAVIEESRRSVAGTGDGGLAARFLKGEPGAVRTIDGWIALAASPFRQRLATQWDEVLQVARTEVTRLLQRGELSDDADPETGLPAEGVWRAVILSCLEALRARTGRVSFSTAGAQDDILLRVGEETSAECREFWGIVAEGLSDREMSQLTGASVLTLRARGLRCRREAAGRARDLLAIDQPPACDDISARLPWFENRSLDPEEQRLVGDHLAGCGPCRSDLEDVRLALAARASHLPPSAIVGLALSGRTEAVSPEVTRRHTRSCRACAGEIEMARASVRLEGSAVRRATSRPDRSSGRSASR
jgi:uncharacterized membrane protein YkvA (DUF1232 family)